MSEECPFAELAERPAEALDADERRRLAAHLEGGCLRCRESSAERARLESLLGDTLATMDAWAAGRADSLCSSIAAAVAREEELRQARLQRRRAWRFALFAITLSAVALLAFAYLGFVAAWRAVRAQRAASAQQRTLAATELRTLAIILAHFQRETGRLPGAGEEDFVRALGTLRPSGTPYFDFDERRLGPGGATYLDPWGTPFRLVWRRQVAQVYSCGPNRRDEAGEGDDIVQGFVAASGDGAGKGTPP
jgi:hypothetical protein